MRRWPPRAPGRVDWARLRSAFAGFTAEESGAAAVDGEVVERATGFGAGVPADGFCGSLFRGSCRFLQGAAVAKGSEDLNRALQLASSSADVRFIVADAYTYGQPDPNRALAEAMLALRWGLDTPRGRAILGVNYLAQGNMAAAAAEFQIHIQQVTTQLVQFAALAPGGAMTLPLVPGRTYEIPVSVNAGQVLSVGTASRDFYDTVLVLLAPDGTPVAASDDLVKYFAGLDWVAPATGIYRLRVTSFEGIDTGDLMVSRK